MDTIWLIRHAEKPDDTASGVTPDGNQDPEALIVRGWQRAGAWTVYFQTPPHVPAQIYASADDKEGNHIGSKSKRPRETVEPLAARVLGGKPNCTYTKGQESEIAQELCTLSGATVVAWQHEAIPQLATCIMGSPDGIPTHWDGSRFDVIWQLTRPAAGQPFVFTQICPCLLAGDLPTPIAVT